MFVIRKRCRTMAAPLRCCTRLKRTSVIILVAVLCATYFISINKNNLDLNSTKSNISDLVEATLCFIDNDTYSLGKVGAEESAKRFALCREIENRLEEEMKIDKGTGCDVPRLDPHSPEIMKFNEVKLIGECGLFNWVECKLDVCSLKKSLMGNASKIFCTYAEIMFVNDFARHFIDPVKVEGSKKFQFVDSDFAEVECKRTDIPDTWSGVVHGHRSVSKKLSPKNKQEGYNILYFGFDSTSKNGFIRKMPKSYKVLTEELGAVVLNKYNIVGDGTPAALFPILTGKNELELPDVRRTSYSKKYMDDFPFIWHQLKEEGYRTSYAEDSPSIGTFQYRFTGFKKQPTNHYIRPFFQQHSSNEKKYGRINPYCVGDTPSYQLMIDRTKEFMRLPGRKFAFTFVADITHDDFNYLGNAEDHFVEFLRDLNEAGVLNNTMLVVFGDHGSRYSALRDTVMGKMEERLPLMSIVLPRQFVKRNPEAHRYLKRNAHVLTTPYDLYNTVLDLIGLEDQFAQIKVKGADLPRSMSLLRKIPRTRSCSEAGVESHWCTCISWKEMDAANPMYLRAGQALVNFINQLTVGVRNKCHKRHLTKIYSVARRELKQTLLQFQGNKDKDGYTGLFNTKLKIKTHYYEVKVSVSPGNGTYEASLVYRIDEDNFSLTARDISRTNKYGTEPQCISNTRPDLNMYCYCKDHKS